ncbi:ABC-type nitrate/sulfonate/bicarbonate transport system substrate-binding protein [Rhodopseudomonas rhenobacensis]|uniref:ABC-type nitrate/sulfonate/bicarbonate transport system substrate-binding protein n=1 Tax=Rhodopseudomonas rhenobacensis TaxID=87461 RepID=A0A7W8DZJ7_9BRAD|nr:ABC transporter substrate-binding protein [Rhodopseudomonas rhenobacensis]MBB5047945.1 ABC-type nitrate/sulfonate/bicarbonate transport system substrate-binding protein [Rhodopseudomonas rhenobacensis]
MMRSIAKLTRVAALAATLSLIPQLASAQQPVRIGQGVSTLSFLPLWAARALNTFAPEGLNATGVMMPGGDSAALAALDSGDIDLAAVGSETVLRAAAKGQPFEIVYTLMSKVTLQLVVSPAFLEAAKVKADDPLPKRLAALKGAVIGVAAIGGTQETAARWLAGKGGLDPKADIKVAQVGNPVALQAALENKRIDAFVLSPPEGYLASKSGSGVVLVSLGDDFPLLADQPYLVLAAKKPIDAKTSELIVKTARALQAASVALVDKPEPTALAIQKQFFAKADPDSIVAAITAMRSGVASGGQLDAKSFQNLLTFSKEVGTNFGKEFDAAASENDLWTNQYVDGAKKK